MISTHCTFLVKLDARIKPIIITITKHPSLKSKSEKEIEGVKMPNITAKAIESEYTPNMPKKYFSCLLYFEFKQNVTN